MCIKLHFLTIPSLLQKVIVLADSFKHKSVTIINDSNDSKMKENNKANNFIKPTN